MPASLSEITQADQENYFLGNTYKMQAFPQKSIGARLMQTQRQSIQAKHRAGFEGFSGEHAAAAVPDDGRLALLKASPEPLQSSSQFGQLFHPIDLTATTTGGLSVQMEQELTDETEKVLCRDALGHFKKCRSCRQKAILELQNINATDGNFVLQGETAALKRQLVKRTKSELTELLALAGAGIFTLFLIDAFSKFGSRLRAP